MDKLLKAELEQRLLTQIHRWFLGLWLITMHTAEIFSAPQSGGSGPEPRPLRERIQSTALDQVNLGGMGSAVNQPVIEGETFGPGIWVVPGQRKKCGVQTACHH